MKALDAVVTTSADRKRVTVALVNRHPEAPAHWKLNMRGFTARSAKATVLSGDSTAYNDIAQPNRVVPQAMPVSDDGTTIELPPHAIAVLQLAS